MRAIKRFWHSRSIAFKLWLALSAVALLFTSAVAFAGAWLMIQSDIHVAEHDAERTATSAVSAASTRGPEGPPPSGAEAEAASLLGLISWEVFDSSGGIAVRVIFSSGLVVRERPDQSLVAQTLAGGHIARAVRLSEHGAVEAAGSLTPLAVVRGGHFGEERWLPRADMSPGTAGAVRLVLAYPDLAASARVAAARVTGIAVASLIPSTAALWFLVQFFVSRPLRRLSRLAHRIANGEGARLPAAGGDELSELAAAVNFMADSLERQAIIDALTGLYNLRHLSSHLDAAIAQAQAVNDPLAVIVGDLDRFKRVNDTYGHATGDRVLAAAAKAIAQAAPPGAICWRLGGDEFVIALPTASAAEARVKAKAIQWAVSEATALTPDDIEIHPAISVGVALYPEDGETSKDLLRVADQRMYVAKAALGDRRWRAAFARAAA